MCQHARSRRLPLPHFLPLFFTIFPPTTTCSAQNLLQTSIADYHFNAPQKPSNAKFADPILGARCDLKCWNQPGYEKTVCLSACLEEPWIKPGKCPLEKSPNTFTDDSLNLERACVNTCRQDNECGGILKCCQHSCGITCQSPLRMEYAFNECTGVPSMPENIAMDINKENPVEDGIVMIVGWSMPLTSVTTISGNETNENTISYNASGTTIYIVEERHHVGKQFVQERLTDWIIRRRSTRSKVSIKNLYRPGRWYVFRVTAINENGTKGPSQPSKPFFAAVSPKAPEVPGDLKVGATSWGNGKLNLQLIWKAPKSDLPIHRYKVTYSRLKNFTLIQHHHTLPPSTTYFWLKDLEPKTEYFLQVQAFSKFGKRRLAGETASIVFNTVHHKHTNRSTYSTDKKTNEKNRVKYKRKIQNFKLNKLYWLRDQLLATISWNPVRPSKVPYYVRWSHNGCHNHGKTWYIAKTQMSTFEVYDLLPECEYIITIRSTWQQSLYMNKITFNTDSCRKDNSSMILPSSLITDCPYTSTWSSRNNNASSSVREINHSLN